MKTNKITIKRIIAKTAVSVSGIVSWNTVKFTPVNLTTGDTYLDGKWSAPKKGDKVEGLLPFYAAAAALEYCNRVNGRVTDLVTAAANDKNLRDAAAAVRAAAADNTAANSEFSAALKAVKSLLSDTATAAASRRYWDNAKDDEITAAAETVRNVEGALFALETFGIGEMFTDRALTALDGIETAAAALERVNVAYAEKNATAAALKTERNNEIAANDAFVIAWFNGTYNTKNN